MGYSLPGIPDYFTQICEKKKPIDSVLYIKWKCQVLLFILILQKSLHVNICTYLILQWVQLLSCRHWSIFFLLDCHECSCSSSTKLIFFWIKGRLVRLYHAINTYSKNEIPHRPQSENYEIHVSEKFWNWHITVCRIFLTTKKHSMMQMKCTGKLYIWI